MKLVIFGLSISSSWGNGHATIWRGLCGALARQRHDVTFFERDVPYYAAHRDLQNSDDYELVLYSEWNDAEPRVREALRSAEAAIVTSYCPDAVCASDMILNSAVPRRVFYDLDTRVTLDRLEQEQALEQLFLEPARRAPGKKFVIGGALYPEDFPWSENTWFVRHVPPALHPAFYCSSKLTLSVTRSAMAEMGYCPSGRLFEAAACQTPVVSDHWEGLAEFFEPGREILIASQAGDVVDALALSPDELWRIGSAARERVLDEHTSDHRSRELIRLLEAAA